MQLSWHSYRYFPYEKELASREASALLNGLIQTETEEGLEVSGCISIEPAKRLTYFSAFANGRIFEETIQNRLENAARSGKNRQATRYSVHGLHEYKGKFNPQVVKALLNIFAVRQGASVLDPFCGSGTTLVECAHIGAKGYGVDINPFAVYVANAKLQALVTPADQLRDILSRIATKFVRTKQWQIKIPDDARGRYLNSWFSLSILQTLEVVRQKVEETAGPLAPFFLTIASNLLRDYSLQDPNDLRIRRRESPLPTIPFTTAFLAACYKSVEKLEAAQEIIGTSLPIGFATNCNLNDLPTNFQADFDAAVTSPPYAMALPYIDTQRLSLVWLRLIMPERVLRLEAELIGSRELSGSNRRTLREEMQSNAAGVSTAELDFCLKLEHSIGPTDGFRREVVPVLLYRYFASMKKSFETVLRLLKHGGRYGLIVGHNHTVLGGVKYDINTPAHLANIAADSGWTIDEAIPLQTYRRYGYHADNAVRAETLILCSKK
jgi:site-specific DNA-methyltransferase (cytosine-N4-specific)